MDGIDRDEDEFGDAGEAICGECARERDFIDIELESHEAEHRIDG